jgi:hypothetical protein
VIVYEKTPPLSVGGPAGTYNIENNFAGSNAEIMIISVTADGAGDAWLMPGQEASTPKNLQSPTRVQWFTFAAQGMVAGKAEWLPYEGKALLVVTGTANVVLCLAWRRQVPDLAAVDAFPTADRATVGLGRVAAKQSVDRTRWGADSWANVKSGQTRRLRDYRSQPGSQGSREAAHLAGDEPETPSTPRGKLAKLLRTGSLR